MKKYFLKYIPVEGKAGKGDTILVNNLPIYLQRDLFDFEMSYAPERVKLFLCSRDIKIGDWLTHINGQETYVDEELLISVNKGRLPNDFKVIGEVNPKLKKLKEGDEFDETEIDKILKK